jgi:FkbM family methyltransferase
MSNIIDWLKRHIRRGLDRGAGRRVLALLMRFRIWQKHGVFARVEWNPDGYWIFRYPEAAVPKASLYIDEDSPRQEEAQALDLFFQEYVPRPGDIIIDVGAELGREINLLSRLVGPTGRVYAIEAHPTTFKWLVRRIEASGLTNVTPLNVAISDQPGAVWISDADDPMVNRLIHEPTGFEVRAVTLDDFIQEHGIERVDYLKMNIEGAERLAVQGMDRSAGKIKNMAVECHDFLAVAGGDDWYRTDGVIREALGTLGFEILERRSGEPREWARGWIYASPAVGSESRDGDPARSTSSD